MVGAPSHPPACPGAAVVAYPRLRSAPPPLPTPPSVLAGVVDKNAQRLLRHLIRRNPAARCEPPPLSGLGLEPPGALARAPYPHARVRMLPHVSPALPARRRWDAAKVVSCNWFRSSDFQAYRVGLMG